MSTPILYIIYSAYIYVYSADIQGHLHMGEKQLPSIWAGEIIPSGKIGKLYEFGI